ncbi:outer membrane protein-like protein iml2 [Bisporella sp. PMI_857]|nr:outer membrane protein-like protein iml2 [Bisporella sp. PMI_857]
MHAEEEDAHLQAVENALINLLNDDIEAAEAALKKADSSYHYLGRGITGFIAAMLGAEKELMVDAGATLKLAENKTWEDMKTARKEPTAYQSTIYNPGTEYELCYAISQLTSAITGVLSGSVFEAIKGFRKLRNAYLTLDGILEVEKKYLRNRPGYTESMDLGTILKENEKTTKETRYEAIRPASIASSLPSATIQDSSQEKTTLPTPKRMQSNLLEQDPAALGITTHTDIFIHSGTRLCYGILLIVFSMIDNPIFSTILHIVGFRGDRARGTRYLWEASRFNNFNSAISGIALLGYYNGLIGLCDILPTDPGANDDLEGYPKARCEALLADMRKRYPDSKLWKLEEARMHGYNRNLAASVKVLVHNSDSHMKQIAVINMFEQGLTTLCILDFELCAKSWIQCAEFSSWSPTLYAFMTGAAYLELYRNLRETKPENAKIFKEKATDFFSRAPTLAGKQKLMAKELPFDIFITRKVKKWQERSKIWGVDLVDVVGVSPIAEQIYLWAGNKKQSVSELNRTLELIDWSRTSHPEKLKIDKEELAISALVRACISRNLRQFDESRQILTSQVLKHERHEFKGTLTDDWVLPNAHYEMSALAWHEKDLDGVDHKTKVQECEQWLEKVQKWGEAYTLDTRMSFKITTSQLTLKRHKEIMGL